jgi:hypothetical protein
MPKTVVSLQFALESNPYISDAGLEYSVNARFVAPPDLDDISIASIAAAVGGVRRTEPAICSDSQSVKPRKLVFIRASGNSVSVPFGGRASVITVATNVRNILNASANANNEVVCIKLEGEEFLNLNDEMALTYDGTTFATSHKAPTTALKQNYVSGVFSYNADAINPTGGAVVQTLRSITENSGNVFAAQLGATPATCIGDLLNILGCGNGKRNPRKHRRYKLSFAIGDITNTQTETIELPVASNISSEILNCGQDAAALTGAYCIGYMGESYSRLHRLID